MKSFRSSNPNPHVSSTLDNVWMSSGRCMDDSGWEDQTKSVRTIPPQNSRPLLRSASERYLEAFAGVLSRFCKAPSLAAEVHKAHSTLLPYSSITVFVGAALVSLEILVGESELFGCFLRLSNYCPEIRRNFLPWSKLARFRASRRRE
jgi:hypothetical protein